MQQLLQGKEVAMRGLTRVVCWCSDELDLMTYLRHSELIIDRGLGRTPLRVALNNITKYGRRRGCIQHSSSALLAVTDPDSLTPSLLLTPIQNTRGILLGGLWLGHMPPHHFTAHGPVRHRAASQHASHRLLHCLLQRPKGVAATTPSPPYHFTRLTLHISGAFPSS